MNDPFVDEIRRFRQEHTQQFQGNLAAICEDLREIQRTCGHPVVAFPPQSLDSAHQPPRKGEEAEKVAA